MCLDTYTNIPTVTDADLLVYKVVLVDAKGVHRAPYRNTVYNMGKMMEAKLGIESTSNGTYHGRYPHYPFKVYEGIHALLRKEDAIRVAESLSFDYRRSMGKTYEVFKAIIPAGAELLMGDFHNTPSIVATKMRFIVEKSLWEHFKDLFKRTKK